VIGFRRARQRARRKRASIVENLRKSLIAKNLRHTSELTRPGGIPGRGAAQPPFAKQAQAVKVIVYSYQRSGFVKPNSEINRALRLLLE